MVKIKVVVIQGPTGVGKTGVALEIAGRFPAEIVNADSMQVYRGMDVGTAKPAPSEQAAVPHHLFSIVDPREDYSAAVYMHQARAAVNEIAGRGHLPLVVGGTGLYLQALLYGLAAAPPGDPALRRRLWRREAGLLHARLLEVDPAAAGRISPNDKVRIVRALEVFEATGKPLSAHHAAHRFREPVFDALRICLTCERAALYRRIDRRVHAMLADGLADEVRGLLERGVPVTAKAMQSIGYRHMVQYLQGGLPLDDALSTMQKDTRRFAKRQLTWFKRNQGTLWIQLPGERAAIADHVKKFLNKT